MIQKRESGRRYIVFQFCEEMEGVQDWRMRIERKTVRQRYRHKKSDTDSQRADRQVYRNIRSDCDCVCVCERERESERERRARERGTDRG